MASKQRFDRIVQITLLLLIAVGIGVIAVSLNTGGDEPFMQQPGSDVGDPDEPSRLPVYAEEAARRDMEELYRTYGQLETETVRRSYSDVAGKVINAPYSVGDRVEQGDIIFTIDPSVPGQEYALHHVKSPISGTITEVTAQEHDRISPQQHLAQISDLDNLKLHTRIPEYFLQQIGERSRAYLRFEAFPNRVVDARFHERDYRIIPATRMIGVTFEPLDQQDLISGMFARVSVVLQSLESVTAVPETAAVLCQGDRVVFVVNGDGTVSRRIIETGLETGGFVEILSGIEAGELVVTAGHSGLTEGTDVRVID